MGFCLRLCRQILSSATELHQIRTGSPLSTEYRAEIKPNFNALGQRPAAGKVWWTEFSVSHLLIALAVKVAAKPRVVSNFAIKIPTRTSHFPADGFPGKTVIKQGKSPCPDSREPPASPDPGQENFDNNLSQFWQVTEVCIPSVLSALSVLMKKLSIMIRGKCRVWKWNNCSVVIKIKLCGNWNPNQKGYGFARGFARNNNN